MATGKKNTVTNTEIENQPPVVNDPAPGAVEHTAATATVQVITQPIIEDLHPGLKRIEINYPKDFKGKKHFVDGSIVPVSDEVAEKFISAGIAKYVK